MFEHPPYEGHESPGVPYGGPVSEERRSRVLSCLLVAVVALLIFGCWAAIATYVYLQDAEEREETERLEAWKAFEPEPGVRNDEPPDARQQAVADEFAEEVLPDCSLEEVGVIPGYYDEEQDFDYADHYILRLSLEEDPGAVLAYEFWAEPTHWAEEGIAWSEEEPGEDAVVARTQDGTVYEYDPRAFEPMVGGASDDAYLELLSTSASDWPEGVITWASDYGVEGASWWVYPTTWEQFADDRAYEGIEAEYVREDGAWRIASWDWYQN